MGHLGRLGVRELLTDHTNTWVEQDADQRDHASRADWLLFVALPVAVMIALTLGGIRLRSADALLTGVSIITGLLFGLLVHVLTLGLRLADDNAVSAGSRIVVLVGEIRANVSWACAVGLILSCVLALSSSFATDMSTTGLPPLLTGAIVGLLTHLVLTLLSILKRVRSTYTVLGK